MAWNASGLFKGFLDLLGDLDFLLVPHQLKEEMLKGRVVEEGSGLNFFLKRGHRV